MSSLARPESDILLQQHLVGKKWITYAWAAWLLLVLAWAARPFLWHLNVFRTVDPRLYLLLLIVLPLLLLSGVGYHFLRRFGFGRHELLVLPVAALLFLALYSPLAVLITVWIVLAAFVTGKQLTDWLGTGADFACSTVAGLGVFSCALFVIGMTGAFRTWVFALLFAVPLVALGKHLGALAKELRSMRSAWIHDAETTAPQVSLAVFVAILLALFTAAAVIAPAWEGDAIRAHLALARAYLIQHSVAVPPALNYGYYPQGFEVLASAAYALGGQAAAQMINPVFFCLTLILIYKIARCCGISRSWAVTGVALGASVPYLHAAGSIIKNDLPFVAFQLAALLFYLRWRDESNFRWIVGSAFFLAMSLDVKLVAIFGAVPLGLSYLPAIWRQPKKLRSAALVATVLVVFGLFWQTRTYLAKGSPLYPANAGIASRTRSKGWRRVVRYLSVPYTIHTQGRVYSYPTPNPLGIVLLLLAPLWLIRAQDPRARRTEVVLWFFVLFYYLPWTYAYSVPRYAIGPVLLLAMLGARRLALFPKWLSFAAMTAALVFALPVTIILEMAPAEIPLLLKQIDGATFLRRTLPPYAAVEFLATRATLSDRVASVGDWAVAYSPNPGLFWHDYDSDRRYHPRDVVQILQQSRANYLILPQGLNLAKLEEAAQQHSQLTRLYQDHDFVVYALGK